MWDTLVRTFVQPHIPPYYWLFVGLLLIACWFITDCLLVYHWLFVGLLLIVCWFITDCLLVYHWLFVGLSLIVCWFITDCLLVNHWLFVVVLLIGCWFITDLLLDYCWLFDVLLLSVCWCIWLLVDITCWVLMSSIMLLKVHPHLFLSFGSSMSSIVLREDVFILLQFKARMLPLREHHWILVCPLIYIPITEGLNIFSVACMFQCNCSVDWRQFTSWWVEAKWMYLLLCLISYQTLPLSPMS